MNSNNTNLTSKNNIADKSLRPALIASEYTISEYPTMLKHLLAGLVDESIPTVLICPPQSRQDEVLAPSVEVINHPAFELPLMGPVNEKILIEKLDKLKLTLLHCLCESQLALTKQLAKYLDIPYILNVNSIPRNRRSLPVSSKRLAKIVTAVPSIAESIREIRPGLADCVESINIGTFVESDCGCFSRTNQIANLFAAHRVDNIGEFENLLEAVKQLAIEDYEFMLVIIGSGPAESQLRKLIKGNGLLQNVVIVPRLCCQRSIFAAGDVFVQPWPCEQFNSLLLEAMSAGCAVAACRGEVDDLIIDNKTAVVFDPRDPVSIHAAIQKLLNTKDFARQIARQGQEFLRQNYSVSEMLNSVLQIYRETQSIFTAQRR